MSPRPSSPSILVPLRPAPIPDDLCRYELASIARTMIEAGFAELTPMALLTAPRASAVVAMGHRQ